MRKRKVNDEKHAYLIKAHHQFALLRKLLMLLDDERNDIYIHIGMDVRFEREELKGVVKNLLCILWRTSVNSGEDIVRFKVS